MAELAVRETLALVEKVIILLYQKFERPTVLHDDVERVQNFLEMMHACLRDSEDTINEDRQLFQQFLDVAYRFEDVLEEFMLQLVTDEALNNLSQQTDDKVANFIASWEPSRKLSSDINEIIGKNTDFVKQLASLPYDSQGGSRSRLGDSLTLPYGDLADGDEVVGFEESKEKLFKKLMDEDPKLLTIFIVGPGGSGKSTLIKNVFKSELVADFFECKAWVPVPRGSHQLDKLLLDMLTQFGKKTSEEIDPKATLRLFLQQKRYVVVLDDVWSKQDLEYIVKALPNGTVGSKMIITSRNSDVVSFLSPEHIHDLSCGLSPEKAKVLFFEKAFHDGQGNRQPEFWKCSDKILKWCGYLPFAISAVGTLLAAKVQTQVEWEDFHKNLGSKIGPASSLEIVSSIFQPSFIDLPNHLKICFLYFSIFPANYGIQRQRLIHLWVAEGFVKPRRGITIEEVAEGYLNELIARNVILAGEREIDGQVQTCCVLGLVRDFILSKEENFVTVKESNPDWRTSPPVEKIRRLSVLKGDCVNLSNNLLDLNHLHTLVIFGSCDSSKIEWVLRKCKYLRVLDLQEISNWEKFPQNVDGVILLKYLRLRGLGIRTVPETIRELRFLENLDLEDTMVKELPEGICQLYNLRRLSVSSCPTSRAGGVMFSAGNIGALSSLQVLTLVNVRNDRIIIKALGELKHVRKLGVVHLETEDGRELCSALEKMKHLSTLYVRAERPRFLHLDQCGSPPLYLQHLYLAGRLKRLPMWISKLTSLQKLQLIWSNLNANPLDVLQALPNLMELDLQAYYSGLEFVFRADTFKKLMKLYIEDFYKLNLMRVEDGALPVLRELTISNCRNLKSLPYGFGGLKSLYGLILEDMPDEFIAMLQKDGPWRHMVTHIPVIRSYKAGILSQDLSENASSTSNTQGSSGGWVGKMSSDDKLSVMKNIQDSAGISLTNTQGSSGGRVGKTSSDGKLSVMKNIQDSAGISVTNTQGSSGGRVGKTSSDGKLSVMKNIQDSAGISVTNTQGSSGGRVGKTSSDDKLSVMKNIQDSAGISLTNTQAEGKTGEKNPRKSGNRY